MKQKKLIILASIVLFLVTIIGIQHIISQQKKNSVNNSQPFITKKNIQHIAISKGNKTLSIKRINETDWELLNHLVGYKGGVPND